MATGYPHRNFIGARSTFGAGESAQEKIREANTINRHATAATTRATTGMSAPYSAHDESPSAMDARSLIDARNSGTAPESPDERWARLFPNRPHVGTYSEAPTISNRDAAMAAGAPTQMVSYAPAPVSTRDQNGMPTNVPPTKAYLDYYQGGMGKRNVGPLINARAGAGAPSGPAQTTQAPTMTPSAPVQATPQFIDPTLPTPVVSDTGITRMAPDQQQAARTSLYQAHPEIFTAGTPENAAFVAHAKQFGEQSAHDNLDKILPQTETPAPRVAANQISAYENPD